MREYLIIKAIGVLKQHGFDVSTFSHSNTCFDLVASACGERFVIKVYENVDGIRPEQAHELKRVASAFGASAIILGRKTKVYVMKDDVLYDRYSIAVLTIKAFANVLEDRMPEKKFFKGKITVPLNSERIRNRRQELGLSLEGLANKIGSTPESIHRYEKGHPASLEIAEKLERTLKSDLIESRNIFRKQDREELFDSNFEDPALEKLSDLGMKIAEFKKAPFKAYSEPKEPLVIHRVQYRVEMKKAAEDAKKIGSTFNSEVFIVAKGFRKKSIDDIPIVDEEDLESFSRPKDLVKEIRKRKDE